MRKSIITFLLFTISTLAVAGNTKGGQLNGIPLDIKMVEEKGTIMVQNDHISITATHGSDMYVSADGKNANTQIPYLYILPKGDFEVSAKLNGSLIDSYDGGGFIIKDSSSLWAKLLFEKFGDGQLGIASTVTNQVGDDVYHKVVAANEVFLKVVNIGSVFKFYSSPEGQNWSYLRAFHLPVSANFQLGFFAQAPLSDKNKVQFTEIKFTETSK